MQKKILIVEDNPDIIEALEIILKGAGYETKAESEGGNVVDLVREYRPHVIILDALLAGHDGPSIARLLKADPRLASIPIILISAHPALERMAEEANVDDFLPKPFSITALLDKLQNLFTERQTV